MSEFTSHFLERLYFNLPPLTPESVRLDLEKELETLAQNPRTVTEVEDIIIAYYQKLWPFVQAFEDLVKDYLKQMGESLLGRKGTYGLKAAYEKYKRAGGTWASLYNGEEVAAFTSEERTELHQLLVDIMCDVRAFAAQAALMSDRKVYEQKIAHYREKQTIILRELDRLRLLAENEENVSLAREIRQHVRDFELGIAALGPALNFEAVCSAHEHFVGRKKELLARGVLHLL